MPLTLGTCPDCAGTGVVVLHAWVSTGTFDTEPPTDSAYEVRCHCYDHQILVWRQDPPQERAEP